MQLEVRDTPSAGERGGHAGRQAEKALENVHSTFSSVRLHSVAEVREGKGHVGRNRTPPAAKTPRNAQQHVRKQSTASGPSVRKRY
jgi:hypothetical protein